MHDDDCPGAPEGWHGVRGADGPHDAHEKPAEVGDVGGAHVVPSAKVRLPNDLTKLRKHRATEREAF